MKKIFKWLENYWYHYKWLTLIVFFFAAVLIFCLLNTGDGIKDDIHILYAGPEVLSDTQVQKMEQAFASLLKDDLNGDGEKSVGIINITIMSDEQIKAAEEEAEKEGQTLIYDPSLRTQALTQVKNLMSTGAVIICLLDPYVYESCQQGTFIPLSSALGEDSVESYDEYSTLFSTNALKNAYDCFSVLSDEVLLCMRNDIVISTNNKHFQKEYAWHKTYFKELVKFDVN